MRRKAPLKRKTPLRRTPWRRQGKAKKSGKSARRNSYRARERYFKYMGWVRMQPCIVTTMGYPGDEGDYVATPDLYITVDDQPISQPQVRCYGEVQADHAGTRAMGRKAHDNTCIPLCQNHHDQKTNGWGLFWGLTLEQKRKWRIDAIAFTQARARDAGEGVPSDA